MTDNNDLFGDNPAPAPRPSQPAPAAAPSVPAGSYSAADIEVLEGLEPVRRRPGMYIGGTDVNALHHLFAEVIDNSMDEAIGGHATRIEVHLGGDGYITVVDNGRGIPVDSHPKLPHLSALEVIMTTLHAGGKFDSKAYETSGGLHGVGVSVVNALTDDLIVEVAREQTLYRQTYSRGKAVTGLETLGRINNRRGTTIKFHPDPQIFGASARFVPDRIFRMTRAKAYLFGGVEIRWSCDEELATDDVPSKAVFHFPGGLRDFIERRLQGKTRIIDDVFSGKIGKPGGHGSVEWAISWYIGDSFTTSYCNTVPTPDGGTHEAGLRTALLRGLKNYADMIGNKRASVITSEDILGHCGAMLSVFIREPEFVGQTKDKLASGEASRIVDNAIRDAFDHWLTAAPNQANKLLAGGSAKQARDRASQAVLPLRGKILNVAGASRDKLAANQLISDLLQALGVGTRDKYREDDLRYDKIIIMTDADVDGAHIASLLMTFFYQELPKLIEDGHLFLALPPLYRLSQGAKTAYAMNDAHKDPLMDAEFSGKGKVEVTRIKGLGEMPHAHLKETTMNPKSRTLLQVRVVADRADTSDTVDRLMGNKPESRFEFISEKAAFVTDLDV